MNYGKSTNSRTHASANRKVGMHSDQESLEFIMEHLSRWENGCAPNSTSKRKTAKRTTRSSAFWKARKLKSRTHSDNHYRGNRCPESAHAELPAIGKMRLSTA